MASNQHYAWAAGHVLFLLASFRYLLAWVFLSAASYSRWYSLAYIGALVSYTIVCYKALGTPQPTGAYVNRFLGDENSQYFLLAAAWFFSKPVPISLIPFSVFSLFHTLTFVRTTIIPQIFQTKAPAPGQQPQAHPVAKFLQSWVKANYDTAMKAVAYIEIAILVRLILGLFVRQSSILSVLVFLHFTRMRYVQSHYTREAFVNVDAIISERIKTLPPVVAQAYGFVQQACKQFTPFGAEQVPQQNRRQSGGPK